jgi:hypothetical protein
MESIMFLMLESQNVHQTLSLQKRIAVLVNTAFFQYYGKENLYVHLIFEIL